MLRIFWRHRWLLAILVLVPVLGVAPLLLMKPITYAATADIQAQAAAPDAQTQVSAILSRVSAVATSPEVVQRAITAAGVHRNAVQVARHEITATSLSSSAVVAVTVTDADRQVAIRLSRSLADVVVGALNGLGTQSSQQLADLTRQRTELTGTRDSLLGQLATASADNLPTTDAHVQALITELNAVETQLAANQAAAQQILDTSAANQGAGVISTAPFAVSASRHVAVYSTLAGLLGLVVGMLIATVRELSHPTVGDAGAAAREIGTVLLGEAEIADGIDDRLDKELASRVDLAAGRIGARSLVLTGPLAPAELTALAEAIDRSLPSGEAAERQLSPWWQSDTERERAGRVSGGAKRNGALPSLDGAAVSTEEPGRAIRQVTALGDLPLGARPADPALVVVLPRFAPRAGLEEAAEMSAASGWPILGVIAVQGRRRRHRVEADAHGPFLAETGSPAVEEPEDEGDWSSVDDELEELDEAAGEATPKAAAR